MSDAQPRRSQDRGHNVPTVTEAAAQDDWAWFKGTKRHYRLRRTADGCWLIRRRAGGVLLRVRSETLPISLADDDLTLRPYWFVCAYPDLPAKRRATLIKEARQSERG